MAKGHDGPLGSAAWRASFEHKLVRQARLAKLSQWRGVAEGAPRFIDGNQAFYFHDGQRQLAWMIAAIDQAKKRVDLEMYIYEPDEVGKRIREALVQAAKRGATVRLLYDAVGGGNLDGHFFDELTASGGQVIEFNPVKPWRLRMSRIGRMQHWQPNNRDHRKLLVCDTTEAWAKTASVDTDEPMPTSVLHDDDPKESAIAIMGGRNIADHYLGLPFGKGQWRDCGVVLFGPVVPALGKIFDAMWELADGEGEAPPISSPPIGTVPVLPLGSQPGLMNLLQWSISKMAALVERSFIISCAYFIPSARFRKALAHIARRDAKCQVMIPLHNDVPIVAAASRHFLGRLLKAGVEVYRYASAVLHEKTFVYDGAVTVVGSSNIDQRSFRLNYELSVIIVGEAFAESVSKRLEDDMSESERYTLVEWRDRPLWEKIVDWFWALFRSQL